MTELDFALADVLENYDLIAPVEPFTLAEPGVNNMTKGLHTGAGDLIWKTYMAHKNREVLLYEHRLLAWLSCQGLPFAVPTPLVTRGGATLLLGTASAQALFPKLPGAAPEPSSQHQAASIGAGLGQLQRALSGYPTEQRLGMLAYGELEHIHVRIPKPFALTAAELELPDTLENATLLNWWRDELAELRSFIDGPYHALPWQVIHSDFGPANTLFDDGQLRAILDFEFATPDARAMDVASGLVFTLRVWAGEPNWAAARAFLGGYQSILPLSTSEITGLPWLMRLRNAVATLWWLGRELDAGDVRNAPMRIKRMHDSAVFLEQHGKQLRALCVRGV